MSDYTIVNLGDVENVAPKFQMPEGMDTRFPSRMLGCTTGGIGVEKLPADVRTPFGHTHSEQEEIYVIAEGSGRIKLDEEIHAWRGRGHHPDRSRRDAEPRRWPRRNHADRLRSAAPRGERR